MTPNLKLNHWRKAYWIIVVLLLRSNGHINSAMASLLTGVPVEALNKVEAETCAEAMKQVSRHTKERMSVFTPVEITKGDEQ